MQMVLFGINPQRKEIHIEENIVLKIDNKGRLTIPLSIRKSLNINSGDIFFIKPEKFGLHIAKGLFLLW